MELYQRIFDRAPCAILIADDEGRFIEVNKAGEDLLGLPRQELLGRKIFEFVSPMRGTQTLSLWSRFKDEGEQTGHFVISRADGTDRLIMYTAVTNFVQGLHLSMAYDITNNSRPNKS